jgi:hypothetical protein
MRRGLTEMLTGKETPKLEPLTNVEFVPRKKPAAAPAPEPEPPRLTTSPFTIDHRAEVIKEMRGDADVLDKQAAMLTHQAISLRISADHLEKNPP